MFVHDQALLLLQFQTELRKILVSLIEVAQRLLALNPDAVELFRKANGKGGRGGGLAWGQVLRAETSSLFWKVGDIPPADCQACACVLSTAMLDEDEDERVDEAALRQLTEMGFPETRAAKALRLNQYVSLGWGETALSLSLSAWPSS